MMRPARGDRVGVPLVAVVEVGACGNMHPVEEAEGSSVDAFVRATAELSPHISNTESTVDKSARHSKWPGGFPWNAI